MSSTTSSSVDPAAASILTALLWSGKLQAVSHGADGVWTVTPASGGSRRLTSTEQVRAYATRAQSSGPAALALADCANRAAAAGHASLRARQGR
jgi:hypothetical protein